MKVILDHLTGVWRRRRIREIEERIARVEAMLEHWSKLTSNADRTQQTLPSTVQMQLAGWKGEIAALKKRLEHLKTTP